MGVGKLVHRSDFLLEDLVFTITVALSFRISLCLSAVLFGLRGIIGFIFIFYFFCNEADSSTDVAMKNIFLDFGF